MRIKNFTSCDIENYAESLNIKSSYDMLTFWKGAKGDWKDQPNGGDKSQYVFVDGQLHPTHAVGQTVFAIGAMKTGRDLDGIMNLADKFPNGWLNPFGRDGDIDKDFTIRGWRFEKYNKKWWWSNLR